MVSPKLEPVAVVGSACRFAGGVKSSSSLWELLRSPRDVLKEIPKERFDLRGYYHPDGVHHGTTNVRHSYMLDDDLRLFDAKFFNISNNETESIDPQQRLLMETVYESMETAGLSIDELKGSDTAVYVGVMAVDYQDILMRDVNSLPTYFATGISRSIISNRISYFFDWRGPSMTIDTACSSSMIAVHQGVQALRAGDSRVAMACGTELILGPENYVAESKMNLLSRTGRSRMWDVDADGYARGDGVATVVMKKLSDAIADGDHVECVIRETGINQDGRGTGGLTVPSSEAQAALIRRTYARAGLDIMDPRDRPQFFESHGTGTKVGDPCEAAAIHECFGGRPAPEKPLFVGSIKTVIGHTEGTAGLAGLLKGSLALQHSTIPPNLLFDRLNPSIEPYYTGLQVPIDAKPWPKVPEGDPRRVSVNSFGFGGTNAHAILESYQSSKGTNGLFKHSATPFTPFTFSAGSEASLSALLQTYVEFLETKDSINLRDLAWTLQSRRSALSVKVAFSATSADRLSSKIAEKLEELKNTRGTSIGIRSTSGQARVLGLFTGQGAQWATMAKELIKSSTFVRERMKHLEDSLSTLPEVDRPSWSIGDELLKEPSASRMNEAELSQPLCTAIQLVLVDMLRSAGITFEAVVGHSSGEIAAAYTAHFISAHDAIRIAYYRGLHAKLAGPGPGQKGAMLAVGTSWEDASALSELPAFKGRVTVAAHNSSASVTMSGDVDAIAQVKMVFEEEKKFVRLLKVDTAYHSHHMLPCSEAYVESLRACQIYVNRKRDDCCTWYSSVVGGKHMKPFDELRDTYWVDNMVKPVMFREAIMSAAQGKANIAIEIGPHPALQGPATQSISDVRAVLPYCGVLNRGKDDIEAFSDALGFVWTQFGKAAVNFESFDKLVSRNAPHKFLAGLPTYQWDHERVYWHESHRSRKIRARSDVFHELLGVISPDSTEQDCRWTNLLKESEIPWLKGHQLQGQTVFPAAGYVAMALEAARKITKGKEVKIFEVYDFVIGKAITFEDDANFAVETLVTLTAISLNGQSQETKTADFSCYSRPNIGSNDMALMASGCVKVTFGHSSPKTLLSTRLEVSDMSMVDTDRFYASLLDLGYGYTDSFRGMSCMKRKLNQASALVTTYDYETTSDTLMIHPTTLDMAFQASLLSQSAPGDQRLWSLHVPTSIECIRVNPHICASLLKSETSLPIDAVLHEHESISIYGDVDIYSEDGQQTLIQVEGLTLVPFSPATNADDRRLFSYTEWGLAAPDGTDATGNERASTEELELAGLCERLSYYYLRKWKTEITDEEWASGEWHHQRLQDSMNHLLSIVASRRHPYIKKEWEGDTQNQIRDLISKWYPKSVDLRLISAVGENMPDVVRGKTTMLEHMLKDNMLDDLYKQGIGFAKYNSYLAKMVKQVAHRYPHMRILEIGAGTGGATKNVLESLGHTFSSYTYTDISTGFFEKAAALFKAYSHKMTFKLFNAEKTPSTQGFDEHTYDMVIASDVLHATSTMQKTMENTRRLLKPGGYLMLLEITNNGPIRIANMTGGLSGWWVGVDDGRQYAPTMSPATWNSLLRKTGFSGVDAITPERDGLAWPFSVIASQAVNSRASYLRKPLSSSSSSTTIEELVILGNKSLETCRISEDVANLVRQYCNKVTILEDLPTDHDMIDPMSTFVNLVDLDEPIFKHVTEQKIDGLKRLFELSKNVLWITQGARVEQPYHMSSIGFGRAISHEMPHMRLQFLDLSDLEKNVSIYIAESVLRLHVTEQWMEEDDDLHAGLLWTMEPELVLKKGQLLVPRILANEQQNARLNSVRRPIIKSVDPQTSVIQISATANDQFFMCEETLQDRVNGCSFVHISHSILSAVCIVPGTFLFLSIGTIDQTNDTVISLSQSNSSVIAPLVSVPFKVSGDQRSQLLSAVAAELLVTTLVAGIPASSNLLVHKSGQDQFFDSALTCRATDKSFQVRFSTQSADIEDKAWIGIYLGASERVTKSKLPAKLTHFLNLTVDGTAKDAGSRIMKLLPPSCTQISRSSLLRNESLLPRNHGSTTSRILNEAVVQAMTTISKKIPSTMVRVDHIGDPAVATLPTTVIDWAANGTVPIQIKPLNAKRLFSSDKTYLLVGLTGQLGQSICEWMARNGAGTICLTSRHPDINSKWLDLFEGSCTNVKVFAMDVANKQDLIRVYNEIKSTLPPIAGVANAAMVLHDTLFTEMSLEMMEKVFRPKIDGTNHLDELFHDIDLDFFVLFSSLSSVVGNSGQSNYAAASTYLTALAAQRRQRGLAASAFDIGRIVGIGYVERAGQVVQDQLAKYGYMPISESDFHQMFAETIRAGRPETGSLPELITGIRAIRDDETVKVPWFDNPRFSHCIVEAEGIEVKKDVKGTILSASVQLEAVTSKEEALEILKECFAAKLQVILQLSAEQINYEIPPIELGIDSLVAVEVRSWFLKELKTDLPVLKILGARSIADLCQHALEKLPEKLVPNMGAGKPLKPKSVEPQLHPKTEDGVVESTVTERSSPSYDISSSSQSSELPSSQSSYVDLDLAQNFHNTEPKAIEQRPKFSKLERISFAQSRFWFLRLLLKDQTTFNVTFYYKVTGNLRISDLERAFRLVGQRHEGLRTCFVADEDEADLAYQGIFKDSLLLLEKKGISSLSEVAVEYDSLKNHEFDLESGKLMRIILLSLSPTSNYLLFNYHHILMDGVSYQILISDLEKAYNRRSLGPLPRQFPNFSSDQRTSFENGDMRDELNFWRGVFPDAPPVLPLLPMARVSSRIPMKTFNSNQVEYRLEPILAAHIKQAAKAQRCTTFHFYLATFEAMLFRFTNAKDLTIGIADANRNDSDVMGTIGLFLNLLTLRFQYEPNKRFAEAVVAARNKAYDALGNSRLPFDVLLKELKVPRSSSHSPIFQAFFDYRQGAQEKQSFGDCQLEVEAVHPGRTAYDITLDVTESAAGALIIFRTQTTLYDQTATELLIKTYTHLLEAFSNDPSLLLQDPSLFSEEQLKYATVIGRGPDMQSDWPETLPHRIDQIASEHEDETAIKDGLGHALTYTGMTDRVEAIAETLQKNSVDAGSRVLVYQQAASDWPCSMLAIMRVGGVYVPLDLRNPVERLADIAENCQPSAILADSTTFDAALLLNVPEAKVINVSLIGDKALARVNNRALPDNPAAILYTSGSTGKPKGIVIKHSSLRNEIEGYTKTWKLGAERVLQQSAFTFNHSSDQMFTGLVNGGMAYIVPWSKRGDPLQVTELILEHDITYTKATPSEYLLWLQYGSSNLQQTLHWRFAFGGGEQLSSTVTQELSALDLPQLRFFNSYGPAEITISSTKMEVSYHKDLSETRIPCGYSLPNYVAYILDEHLRPLPAGMPGEIVMGGAGVSMGYLNNDELTNRHFVPDPYATPEYVAKGWTTMYRTGDIGHLHSDGSLVFHSRIAGDTQIKIRGLRIEIGDIESSLVRASNGALREAVVMLYEGDPEFLVAHVVFGPQHGVTDREEFLQDLLTHLPLPQYMIPIMAIPLDSLPLNNHSKINRSAIKALPLPQRATTRNNDLEFSESMVRLKQLWEDVLNNKQLGFNITPSTSFFSVGGNSLLIVRLQSRIRNAFNIVVRLVELLSSNTLGEMAQKIESGLTVDLIDWEKETELPDLGCSLPTSCSSVHSERKVVLLTGATGFLGKYILARLVDEAQVSQIHCVAIRPNESESPRNLAVPSPKIVTHAGNLSEPRLGLSEADFEALAGRVDVILHLGAIRSFWDNYHVLRPSNVSPTKQLVLLAAARRIPIHYTSSAGVLPVDARPHPAASVAAYAPAKNGTNGYVASRWASEQILERAATKWGVPVSIHRFVPAAVASRQPTTPVLDEMVRFADRLRLMPELGGWKGHFYMAPAETVAESLCETLLSTAGAAREETLRFVHHECRIRMDVGEMQQYCEERIGKMGYQRIPGLQWVGRIKPLGFGYFFASQDVTVESSSEERTETLESRR